MVLSILTPTYKYENIWYIKNIVIKLSCKTKINIKYKNYGKQKYKFWYFRNARSGK